MKPQTLGRSRRLHPEPQSSQNSQSICTTSQAIKTASLVVITVQNCSLMMVTSYSLASTGPKYLHSTAVAAGELVKTLVVLLVLMRRNGPRGMLTAINQDVCGRDSRTMRYAVPALFYTVQNNLWYHAMANLDSVTAAVMSQLKVPSTAIFSIVILHKQLYCAHWVALAILVGGLVCMQSGQEADEHTKSDGTEYYLALLSMIAACTSSGYAGVTLELLFKQLNADVWTANLQLQTFCVPIALSSLILDWEAVERDGFLQGWDKTTCIVVLLNALGGFAVSLTMKYADNILKTFAVSLSLVLNCMMSALMDSVDLDVQDCVGVLLVISSTFLYSKANSFHKKEAPGQIDRAKNSECNLNAIDEEMMTLTGMESPQSDVAGAAKLKGRLPSGASPHASPAMSDERWPADGSPPFMPTSEDRSPAVSCAARFESLAVANSGSGSPNQVML